ncbi:hypothetical protein [Sphingomonas sp. KR3-1]|uniref:hypothetical protein n=1 Tax=Sphingomonas sp. KR3-1 TaxID=3156611 RepID=UPI0032B4BB38
MVRRAALQWRRAGFLCGRAVSRRHGNGVSKLRQYAAMRQYPVLWRGKWLQGLKTNALQMYELTAKPVGHSQM